MQQLVNYEFRNKCRRWVLPDDKSILYVNGSLCDNNANCRKVALFTPNISVGSKTIGIGSDKFQLGNRSKAYSAFLLAKRENIQVVCDWIISKCEDTFYVQSRDYETFALLPKVKIEKADGPFLIVENGEKILLDPLLCYWATPYFPTTLPENLRPDLIS